MIDDQKSTLLQQYQELLQLITEDLKIQNSLSDFYKYVSELQPKFTRLVSEDQYQQAGEIVRGINYYAGEFTFSENNGTKIRQVLNEIYVLLFGREGDHFEKIKSQLTHFIFFLDAAARETGSSEIKDYLNYARAKERHIHSLNRTHENFVLDVYWAVGALSRYFSEFWIDYGDIGTGSQQFLLIMNEEAQKLMDSKS